MKGLAILLGVKKKGAGAESEEEEAPESEGTETSYAKEAYSALKDDDEDGFVSAILGAVRACVANAKAGKYDDEEEAEGE